MSSTFVITLHAQQRYVERVGGSLQNAKQSLQDGIKSASRLKEKTHRGELLYINPEIETIFIVKPDESKLWVVSVLSLSEREKWEAKHRAEVEEAARVLPPLESPPRNSSSAKLLSHIEQLEAVNSSLRKKNQLLASMIQNLQSELAQFRKEERKALYKSKIRKTEKIEVSKIDHHKGEIHK